MIVPIRPQVAGTVYYPDSDGKPIAENTLRAQWIVTIMTNLDRQYRDDANVFVAMDNFIYPVEGDPTIVTAPDIYIAFGRPKGHRGSYRVWEEGHIFPQVVFEILSPSNTRQEMQDKREFYFNYGAEEFYIYDPDRVTLEGFTRTQRRVNPVTDWATFRSPRLGIRFELQPTDLVVYGANGERFLTVQELGELAEHETQRADREARRARREAKRSEQATQQAEAATQKAREATKQKRLSAQRANAETQRANEAAQRANAETQRATEANEKLERLRAKLRAAGIDPDATDG